MSTQVAVECADYASASATVPYPAGHPPIGGIDRPHRGRGASFTAIVDGFEEIEGATGVSGSTDAT